MSFFFEFDAIFDDIFNFILFVVEQTCDDCHSNSTKVRTKIEVSDQMIAHKMRQF